MTMRAVALIPAFNEARHDCRRRRGRARGGRPRDRRRRWVDRRHRERAREAGAEVVGPRPAICGKGHAVRTGLARVFDGRLHPRAAARRRHAASAAGSLVASGRSRDQRRRRRDRRAAVRAHADAGLALPREPDRQPRLSWFVGVPVHDTQCGFRVFRIDALRRLRLRATGYEIETEMLVKVRRRGGRVAARPGHGRLRPASGASCDRCATRRAPVFWRCTIDSLNASESVDAGPAGAGGGPRHRLAPVDLHGLNSGDDLRRDLPRRRRPAARGVVRDRRRRDVARVAADARDARRARRQPPRDLSRTNRRRRLERRARETFGAYARDVIDFLRALGAPATERQALFDYRPEDAQLFDELLAKGRGIILVTGHYGNWEVGGVFHAADRESAAHDHGDGRNRARR